jgi:hypothetical protein
MIAKVIIGRHYASQIEKLILPSGHDLTRGRLIDFPQPCHFPKESCAPLGFCWSLPRAYLRAAAHRAPFSVLALTTQLQPLPGRSSVTMNFWKDGFLRAELIPKKIPK